MILRYQKINFLAVMLVSFVLGVSLPGSSHAASTALGEWQRKIAELRTLAENDAPQAYLEAQLLQKKTPAGVTLADRARMLNLLSRIELHLALIPESVLHGVEAKSVAKQGNDAAGQVEADLNIALGAINQGRLDDMIASTNDGMSLLETIRRDDLRAEMMFQAAMMYLRFGQLEESITVAMQALEIASNIDDPRAHAYAEQSMGVAYVQSGRHADARVHYLNMLEAARQAHYTLLEAAALLGLSSAASGMGDIEEGVRLIEEALKLFRRVGAPFYVSHAQHLLADIYVRKKQPEKALPLFHGNVKIYEKYENPIGLWWTLQARSHALQTLGRLGKARGDAARAYGLAQKIGFNIYMSGSAQRLADIIAAQGDHKEAYRWSVEAAALKEKADREKSGKRVLDLAKRFREESKQRRIDELSHHNELQHAQQRQMQIVLGAMLMLLGITVYFLLRLRKSREAIRSLNVGLEQRVQERTVELLESRQSLAEAQRIAQIGSWENNLVDNVLTWSDETYRIFEIDPQHFGTSYEVFMELVHPDDREMLDSAFKASLENRQPFEIEHRLLLPDGRIKYVHEHCETSYAADGRPLCSIGTVQDITGRKLAEQRLKQALEFSEGIINAIPDILFEMDRNGRYLNVWTQNPELLAAQKEMLLGKTVSEVLSPENATIAMESIREADEKGISTGKVMCIDLPQDQRWFEHSLAKKPGHTPSATTFIVLSRDITERKRMEDELATRERNFRSLTENLPDNVARWDTQGRYLYINPTHAQTLGIVASEIIGKALPDSHDHVKVAIAQVVATGKAIALVRQPALVDGKPQIHEVSLAPEYDTEGRIVSVVGLGRNMTEIYRMQDVIATRERELRALADSSPGMMGCFHRKPDGSVCMPYVSPNIYELYGLQPQDVFEDASALMKRNHPDDAQRVMDTIAESARTMTTWHCEFRIQHPTKGERWMEGNTNPEPHPEGGIIWYGYIHDVTDRKLFEQKLKEALEFNEGVINAIPDLLFEMNKEGRYLNIWTHTPELLAAQNESLLGNTVSEMLAPEAAATVLEALREAELQGFSFGKVIHLELPQGTSWFELSVSQKTGGTFLVLSRDITERKRMEVELGESEARYRYHYNQLQSMLESSSRVSIFALDREYRYLFFNNRHREGAKRIRGADIAIGMNMLENINNLEFRDFCRQGFDQVLAGNCVSVESKEEVINDGNRSYEYNDNYGSPIFDDKGDVVGLTVFAINTTERKRLEAELRASRNFLDSVIDAVPDPIFVKDRQHRWVLLNDANCKFTGLPREALLGKSDYDIFPKGQADVFWEKDELVFDSGEVNLNEESFTSADGEAHYIQTKKTPFVSADGSKMLVGVIRDITERIHYEAARERALVEAERLANMRSEFIAHMSHELRTPLNGILGYAQILERDGKLDEKQRASMEVIRQSGEHLLSLIEDILDIARIESGRLELDISDIPLARFLNVIASIIGVRAKQKQIKFVCEFAPDLPQGIRGDEKRLRQVLLNLLSNAVKFTDQGKVTLSVRRVTSSRLVFAVTDTGIGIESSDREAIFHSFEQVSDRQHRLGGTGLGLSISRQLVQLMGGDIVVDSRPGKGSTFYFELELPDASIEPEVLRMPAADTQHIETDEENEPAKPLIAPPQEELQALHQLALMGNMRDIAEFAERITSLDPRYGPFAGRLKRMATGYQSKSILAFVEEYLI